MDYQPPYTLTPDIVSLVAAIAEMVTGKLDVREVVAKFPDLSACDAQAGEPPGEETAKDDQAKSVMDDLCAVEEKVASKQGGCNDR